MIGLHIQESPRDWPIAVEKLPGNAMMKILFGVERCRESKAHNPEVATWYRWVGYQPLPHDNFEQHARNWISQFVDDTFRREARHVDYINGYNETLAASQSPEEKARWIALHTAMAKVWHDEFRQEPALAHIKLIMCETAVGNDIPWELAKVSVQYDAVLGYHPYIVCRNGQVSPHDWEWYSGRWDKMDTLYRSKGYQVQWAFGEGGPVLDASTNWSGWLDPLGGWRNPLCLNGDINVYMDVLDYWLQKTFQTHAYRTGRVLGLQLFTSGAPGGYSGQWGNFNLEGADMQRIAAFSGNYTYPPTGGTTPTLPPPPPPPPVVPPPVDPPIGIGALINGGFDAPNGTWGNSPDKRQQYPQGWSVYVAREGEKAPGREYEITTTPEMVHKGPGTLPGNELYGGDSEAILNSDQRAGLVLSPDQTYKIFGTGQWYASMNQKVSVDPNTLWKLEFNIDVHWHGYAPGNNSQEDEDIVVKFSLGDSKFSVVSHALPDRTWVPGHLLAEANDSGLLDITIEVWARWAHPRSVFIDSVCLTPEPYGPDPYPPDEDEKYVARVPYARHVWVLPADASPDQWAVVARDAQLNGRTVTSSYDDGGIGEGLKSRTVTLFGIRYEQRRLFQSWYDEHYTGTKVLWAPLPITDPVPDVKMSLPLGDQGSLTQRFGERYEVYMARYGIPGHNGVDWAAATGTPVKAALKGTVKRIDRDNDGYGLYVILAHQDGLETLYAHLDSVGITEVDDLMVEGEVLGWVNNTGWSSGPHLHFGVKHLGQSRDPELFLGPLE